MQQVFSFLLPQSLKSNPEWIFFFFKYLPVSYDLLFYSLFHLFPQVSDIPK